MAPEILRRQPESRHDKYCAYVRETTAAIPSAVVQAGRVLAPKLLQAIQDAKAWAPTPLTGRKTHYAYFGRPAHEEHVVKIPAVDLTDADVNEWLMQNLTTPVAKCDLQVEAFAVVAEGSGSTYVRVAVSVASTYFGG